MDDYVRDVYGNIDDFSAPAGSVGHPAVQKLSIYNLLRKGMISDVTLLRNEQYNHAMVRKIVTQIVDEVYLGKDQSWMID